MNMHTHKAMQVLVGCAQQGVVVTASFVIGGFIGQGAGDAATGCAFGGVIGFMAWHGQCLSSANPWHLSGKELGNAAIMVVAGWGLLLVMALVDGFIRRDALDVDAIIKAFDRAAQESTGEAAQVRP